MKPITSKLYLGVVKVKEFTMVLMERTLLVQSKRSSTKRISNNSVALLQASLGPLLGNMKKSAIRIPTAALKAPSGFLELSYIFVGEKITTLTEVKCYMRHQSLAKAYAPKMKLVFSF